ncbi:MAG: DUF1697 domain-containing protein [Herpetosiphonaceae bacterium]|nr:DUF1697 domain-containing protein [Herpetosiphonaceae bacterium]
MQTYIILLRGVMPTGKNKVLMAPLRAALEQAGLLDVQTYIQSGNIIATSPLSQLELEHLVHEVIEQDFGGDIAVLARTVEQFRTIFAANPFPNADTAKLHFTLLATIPEEDLVKQFLAPGYTPDEVKVIRDMVYIHCATTYSAGKLNNNFIERKLKVAATTRVYNTIAKLVALSSEK